MKIAFFLTGHGFGHGVRSSALISALPAEVEVDIYTSLPGTFFEEELNRPFNLVPCEIDCGCLQSDTVEVDVAATLARYAELDADRSHLIPKFAALLKSNHTDMVVGDIPPLAFPIAKAAGLPAWSLCNFDWTDIYRPFLEKHPRYEGLVNRMTEDYALADRRIRFFPNMSQYHASECEEVGLVCRPGTDNREAFAQYFGLNITKKWCLVYIGSFGLKGVKWERLADFPEWEFIGLYPLEGAPGNYHHIKKNLDFRYADLTATCDLVLGKLGYGLVAECLSLGKPVLFLGRNGFSEFAMLRQLLIERRMGLELSLEQFLALDIGDELKTLVSRKITPLLATGITQILEKMGLKVGFTS